MKDDICMPNAMENEPSILSDYGHWSDLRISLHSDSVDSSGGLCPQVRRARQKNVAVETSP